MMTYSDIHATGKDLPRLGQFSGQIDADLPGAAAVFRRPTPDLYRSGQINLTQAAPDIGVNVQAALTELMAIQRENHLSCLTESATLFDHIHLENNVLFAQIESSQNGQHVFWS